MSSPNRRTADEVVRTIYRAVDLAKDHNHEAVTLEHLLLSLIDESDVQECLTALSVNRDLIADQLALFMEGGFVGSIPNTDPTTTKIFDEVVTRAIAMGTMSREAGGKPMPVHILIQLAQAPLDDSFALSALRNAGLDSLALKKYLAHGQDSSGLGGPSGAGMWGGDDMNPARDIANAEDAILLLAKYTVNLNEAAAEGTIDPLIGREDEVASIIQIVARRTKNNIALIGEPGVGKTAIAEGLARKILLGEVPDAISNAEVFSLDIGALMAGTRFRGDLEERMKQVLKALTFIEHPILFIDEIHTIMGTGSGNQGSLDIANLLKPALAKGTLRCIGSTTYEEYRKHFEKDRALLRRFKRVDVREPDVETAKKILHGLKPNYEAYHGVTFTDEAIDAAVDLTNRYVTNALLPDKAIDIIDNAGARQKVAPEAERLTTIDVEQIELEVSKVAKIPEQSVKEDETHRLQRLEEDLRSAVFGQDEALSALADAVFVSRSGLRDTNKPAGSFLFAGPTGVGKTEAARQLAKTLGVPLLKFDMSEYMEKHSVAKLIGSPPGYVGYGDGGTGSGKLINDVEAHPYSVLLLDEMEKAHPDVFNIFLQVMDDGKLTNSSGKSVDFRNVIVIMTTNAGARELTKNQIGFAGGPQKIGGDPTAEINRTFSPEFRNRLDTTVQFERLGSENVGKVVEKFLVALAEQARERGVILEVSEEAKKKLADLGFDRDMGARPLARAIHDHVKKPLSRLMVVGSLKEGGTAHVGLKDGKVMVSDEPIPANDEAEVEDTKAA